MNFDVFPYLHLEMNVYNLVADFILLRRPMEWALKGPRSLEDKINLFLKTKPLLFSLSIQSTIERPKIFCWSDS